MPLQIVTGGIYNRSTFVEAVAAAAAVAAATDAGLTGLTATEHKKWGCGQKLFPVFFALPPLLNRFMAAWERKKKEFFSQFHTFLYFLLGVFW